jgi:predicted DsbA family dithiol-disulfide isomerase
MTGSDGSRRALPCRGPLGPAVQFLVWLNWTHLFPPSPKVPSEPVSLEGATLLGEATAPVVLIEFTDYLCPFCAKFEEDTLPELNRLYIETGRVQLALRHHPLEQLHPGSTKASEAALCGQQQKFWEMHAALFRQKAGLEESHLTALARDLDMDEDKFSRCLSGERTEQVRRDISEADRLGLSGTPAFLVGRRLSDGAVVPGSISATMSAGSRCARGAEARARSVTRSLEAAARCLAARMSRARSKRATRQEASSGSACAARAQNSLMAGHIPFSYTSARPGPCSANEYEPRPGISIIGESVRERRATTT